MAAPETKATLPLLFSLNAGYVDAAGYLALKGLLCAHVTGNLVTLGASLTLGTSGAIAKLSAIPIFCAVIVTARLLNTALSNCKVSAFEVLVAIQVLLLIVGAAFATRFGPFHDGDSWQAVLTGMVLVAAMAIQNAFYRVHLGNKPPSTIMTGTITQVMIDLADRIYGPKEAGSRSGPRLLQMSTNIVLFAIGCGAGALLYTLFGTKCFVLPPVVGSLPLLVRLRVWPQSPSTQRSRDSA